MLRRSEALTLSTSRFHAGLIGRYIRSKLEDTPAFREMSVKDEAVKDEAVKAPVNSLFRDHWASLGQAAGAVLLNAVGFDVILSYMPTQLSEELGLRPHPTSPPRWPS